MLVKEILLNKMTQDLNTDILSATTVEETDYIYWVELLDNNEYYVFKQSFDKCWFSIGYQQYIYLPMDSGRDG